MIVRGGHVVNRDLFRIGLKIFQVEIICEKKLNIILFNISKMKCNGNSILFPLHPPVVVGYHKFIIDVFVFEFARTC